MRIPVPSAKIAQPAKAAPHPSLASRPAWKPRSERGTVVLVALCFVAVLGLMLASYLAVTSRAMQLSNRSFQSDLSRQLAEAGLEEALRAFNKNDWSDWTGSGMSVDWTLDAAARRATATISYPSNKFSQGLTAQVKIRVDNYDADELDATWSSTRTYNIGDLVGLNGTWYRCVKGGNLNKNPSTQTTYEWWVPAPIPWQWTSHKRYTEDYDIVCYDGQWRICNSGHTSGTSFAENESKWTPIPAPSKTWAPFTPYVKGQFVYQSNRWYRCISNHNSSLLWSWDASKWTSAAWNYLPDHPYSYNDIVNHNGTWYRYISTTSEPASQPPSPVWNLAFNGSAGWSSSGVFYARGAVVYYNSNGRWYRCTRAHTSGTITPTNTNYWSPAPKFTLDWDPRRQFNVGDVVRYQGVWYRCTSTNTNNEPPAHTGSWVSADNPSTFWNATTSYAVNSYVSYGGVWYRCVAANSNQTPNNADYWVAVGAPVVYSEGRVALPDGSSVKTQLRSTLSVAPLFPNAISGTTAVNLSHSGSTGIVDSYNSNPTTTYSAVPTSNYSADTATYSATIASLGTVTTAGGTIRGYVSAPSASTTPFAPSWIPGTSAELIGPGSSGHDLSRVSRSPYIPTFPISSQPTGVSLTVTSGFLGTPGATTPTVYTYNADMRLHTDSEKLTIIGPTILRITGNLRIHNNPEAGIRIATGGSLCLIIGGTFRAENTGGGIDNQTLDPSKLTILCTRIGAGTFEYSAAQPLYGTLYFPSVTSNFTIGNNAELFGAISAQSITFSQPAKVHYDTSLRYATIPGVEQPYTVSELRELPADEWATLP